MPIIHPLNCQTKIKNQDLTPISFPKPFSIKRPTAEASSTFARKVSGRRVKMNRALSELASSIGRLSSRRDIPLTTAHAAVYVYLITRQPPNQ
jgi:hypothetical protein